MILRIYMKKTVIHASTSLNGRVYLRTVYSNGVYKYKWEVD